MNKKSLLKSLIEKLKCWKKKSVEKKIIKAAFNGELITIDGKEYIIIDVGKNYIVCRDEKCHTYRFER